MAGKNWQAGGKDSIPALALVCLLAVAVPCGLAWAAPLSSTGFAPTSYVGELDPNMIWELLIGGIVVASFLAAAGLWVLSAARKVKRSHLRRSALVNSALNHLSQGVVMTDAVDDPGPTRITLAPGARAESALVWRNTVTSVMEPAVTGASVEVTPMEGAAAHVVALNVDLGNTGTLDVTAWRRS